MTSLLSSFKKKYVIYNYLFKITVCNNLLFAFASVSCIFSKVRFFKKELQGEKKTPYPSSVKECTVKATKWRYHQQLVKTITIQLMLYYILCFCRESVLLIKCTECSSKLFSVSAKDRLITNC